jgi:hypothetical protein
MIEEKGYQVEKKLFKKDFPSKERIMERYRKDIIEREKNRKRGS